MADYSFPFDSLSSGPLSLIVNKLNPIEIFNFSKSDLKLRSFFNNGEFIDDLINIRFVEYKALFDACKRFYLNPLEKLAE